MSILPRNLNNACLTFDLPEPENKVSWLQWFGEQVAVCSFCGEKHPVALWRVPTEEGFITTCRSCALEHLPCLLADALVGEDGAQYGCGKYPALLHELERFTARFWQAVACALCRIAEGKKGM
jgi:hypothetical protein